MGLGVLESRSMEHVPGALFDLRIYAASTKQPDVQELRGTSMILRGHKLPLRVLLAE